MEMSATAQWIAFFFFAFVAVAGGLGMTTTMSMFRSGVFLMASFIGVAGLFLLLSADLLGLLQVMMYIGGMLVMILFMVLFSSDPGGDEMTSQMKLPALEKLFSRGLAHPRDSGDGHGGHGDHGSGHEQHGGGHGQHGNGMSMSMFTPIKKPAAILALITGALLVTLVLAQPVWPTVRAMPDTDSARRVGHLLMSKYMIAFEGAGLLILLGIFGAVFVQRPGTHPDPGARDALQAAVDDHPAPITAEAPHDHHDRAGAREPEESAS